MSFEAVVYRVLIASPSDVVAERKAIPEVLFAWNAVNSAELGIVLLPVMWESHSLPEMGDRPQAIINKQIVKDCDILIGAFWTRIGTHTGVAESGTVEEIEEFLSSGKPVMLYFSSAPVVLDSVEPEQYQKLTAFKKKCQTEGLIENYSSVAELREKLNRHLTTKIRSIHNYTGVSVRESNDPKMVIKEQFRSFLRRCEAEWVTERDSKPYNLDEGKYILRRMGQDLLEFRLALEGQVDDKVISIFDDVMRESKSIQRHQVYMDGGQSYREFWQIGDSLIKVLKDQIDYI